MKIYIDGIIYSLQKGGGITHYTDKLIDGLIQSGYDVTVFVHLKTCNKTFINKKVTIVDIESPLKTENKIIRLLTYPIHKWKTEKYIKTLNINAGVFHSTYFTNYRNLKIPQVLTIHDLTREKFPEYFNNIDSKIFLMINKKSIKKANSIICVSEQTKDDLVKYYKVNPDKISVTLLGVGDNYSVKTEKEKEKFKKINKIDNPYILFVGRRSLYKNFKNFVEAFASWDKRDIFNIITVGGGQLTKEENILLDKIGIKNKIINFDFAKEEDLVMFYNCANSFIFPSFSEGFGLPILEAMSCGTQVLASDIPVFKEVARDIPHYFNPSYKESIMRVLDESMKLDQMKINSGLELVKNFNWENTVEETYKIYNKISNEKQ